MVREVWELRRKEKGTLMAFLDESKAYDTVWREGLNMRRNLGCMHVKPTLIGQLHCMHELKGWSKMRQ